MKTKNQSFMWIVRRSKKFLPLIALTCTINILLAISYVYLASLSRAVIDNASSKITASVVALILTAFSQVVFNALLSVINVRINGGLVISMRKYMFSSITHKKYPEVFDHHSGDLLNRFTSDVDQVVTGVVNILPNLCSTAAKIVAGVGALLIQNYILAIIVVVLGILFPFIGRTISKRYKYMHKEVQRTEGETRAFLQESFANIVVVKTFSSERPILRKLNEYMQKNLKMRIKRNFVMVTLHAALSSFFSLGYYIVLIWGASQIANGMSYGTLTYYLQLITLLRAPLQNVSGILPQYYSMIASAERLIELENIEDEPGSLKRAEIKKLYNSFKEININNVDFSYGNENILSGCTFTVPRGGITAITGESGSGKSTLFKLILGLYEPDTGTITIDGKTPVDSSTRALFSYVPQGNMILSGTIRDNLTLCNDRVSDEQIEKATKTAVIYDLIKSLPDGLDTHLSERGAGLSEGQIQRISIARALLFDAPVLLFDESTSALDEQTETELLSNIKNMTDKTVLFITHRNTSISVCDHIIHVESKHFERIK